MKQIETFQNNLSTTNFRKLIEHLISENEKVLKSTAYQVSASNEEEKKRESSGESEHLSSSSDEHESFCSFGESRFSPEHRVSLKRHNSESRI